MQAVVDVHEPAVVVQAQEVHVEHGRGCEQRHDVQEDRQHDAHRAVVLVAVEVPVEFERVSDRLQTIIFFISADVDEQSNLAISNSVIQSPGYF